MQESDKIERKIEETLNSLDGINCAKANPFLFTRVQARLAQPPANIFEKLAVIAGRPAFAMMLICLVLGTNLVVVWKQSADRTAFRKEQTQLAVADEYKLDVPSLYDYENPEP